MGRWHLVRHGETEWNRIGKIQGHSDVPLNEHGRRQVEVLARRLDGRRFSTVYASDLSRARETAQAIVEGSDAFVETDPDLREFFYGEWEGLTLEEAKARDPMVFAKQMSIGNHKFSAPGGEDSTELLHRVRRFYTGAVDHHDAADNLLIVAHAGPIRALVICLLGLTDDYFWRFRVDCAGLSVINSQSGVPVLEFWNDTSHLDLMA